ncbi:MAG: hypothetical protein JSR80_05410 [Verrucomicrobia bacterium]|nr:hypothetical protein [Verrucomicrobiota bacterium]
MEDQNAEQCGVYAKGKLSNNGYYAKISNFSKNLLFSGLVSHDSSQIKAQEKITFARQRAIDFRAILLARLTGELVLEISKHPQEEESSALIVTEKNVTSLLKEICEKCPNLKKLTLKGHGEGDVILDFPEKFNLPNLNFFHLEGVVLTRTFVLTKDVLKKCEKLVLWSNKWMPQDVCSDLTLIGHKQIFDKLGRQDDLIANNW